MIQSKYATFFLNKLLLFRQFSLSSVKYNCQSGFKCISYSLLSKCWAFFIETFSLKSYFVFSLYQINVNQNEKNHLGINFLALLVLYYRIKITDLSTSVIVKCLLFQNWISYIFTIILLIFVLFLLLLYIDQRFYHLSLIKFISKEYHRGLRRDQGTLFMKFISNLKFIIGKI